MTLTADFPTVPRVRLPAVTYVLTAGTFLMGTSEFVAAGLLPGMAADLGITVAHASLSVTVFALGMILGAPTMAVATLRLPRRLTLTLALVVFALGHVVVALTSDVTVLLAARFVTAVATGAFWAVASVVAAQSAGPALASRALGIVLGGGMLATVIGVPLGTFVGQYLGWRGAFWALAVLAAATAVFIAARVPADGLDRPAASVRDEIRALGSVRLWLTLATCALITGSVLSVFSFIAPILTVRTGLPESVVPLALLSFGIGALVGNIVGGRVGDRHPYRTTFATAGLTIIACTGLALFSTEALPALVLFALLGLVGLSANPVLVALAVRFGGAAPTLATAMPTSIFNLGTAAGTGISAALLESPLRELGPLLVGLSSALLILVPLGMLAARDRPRTR